MNVTRQSSATELLGGGTSGIQSVATPSTSFGSEMALALRAVAVPAGSAGSASAAAPVPVPVPVPSSGEADAADPTAAPSEPGVSLLSNPVPSALGLPAPALSSLVPATSAEADATDATGTHVGAIAREATATGGSAPGAPAHVEPVAEAPAANALTTPAPAAMAPHPSGAPATESRATESPATASDGLEPGAVEPASSTPAPTSTSPVHPNAGEPADLARSRAESGPIRSDLLHSGMPADAQTAAPATATATAPHPAGPSDGVPDARTVASATVPEAGRPESAGPPGSAVTRAAADAAPAAAPQFSASVATVQPTSPAQTTAPAAPAAPSAPPASPPLAAQLSGPVFSLAASGAGEHVMTMTVTPDELGPVTVRAQVSADGIRVELFAQSDLGRDALRGILGDLRRDLGTTGSGASLDLSPHDAPADDRDRTGSDSRRPIRELGQQAAADVASPAPRHLLAAASTIDVLV